MSRVRSHLRLLVSSAALLGAFACGSTSAAAQGRPVAVVSQPVVQSIPGGEGMKLNDALGRLAKDPRDVAALLDAGKASLDLGDVDAAIGFFQRASALSPGDARAKAGLAGAYVQKGDPFAAIPLFREAQKEGSIDPARLSDRGLAYDLVGDNLTAQQYYRQSLSEAPSDETLRRLAISQAISGDRRGMEVTLSTLLQKQDKAAWRTRAFALAILGYGDEAEAIARQSLPADRAAAMSAYLRYMPRLTAAQQARAGNLGHFPRAAEIGTDDPRVAQYARPHPVLAAASTPAPAAAAAKGKAKGRVREAGTSAVRAAPAQPALQQAKPPVQVALAPPEPHVSREVAGAPATTGPDGELPPVSSQQAPVAKPALAQTSLAPAKPAPAPAPKVTEAAPLPVSQPVAAASAPSALPSASAAPSLDQPRANPAPGFDLRQVAPAPAPASAPVAAPAPVSRPAAPAPRQASLEEVFADFTPPSREAEPEAGAVDVRKLPVAAAGKDLAAKEPAGKDAATKDASGKAVAGKDVKGKDLPAKGAKGKADKEAAAKDAAKDAKLALCDEPVSSKGKGKTKGKAAAKSDAKSKGKAGAKSGKEAVTQCKDGKPVKAAKTPSQPSRIWVQIAAGKNKKALDFDWRRFVKENPATFKGREGYTSAWGATNRLLTGPFETEAAAKAYVAKLKKAGFDGVFMWLSPAGQVVDSLP